MDQLSVIDIIGKYNLVIPEIQREYVWGLNIDNILSEFLNDIKDSVKISKDYESYRKKEIDIQSLEIITREGVDGFDKIKKLQEELKSEKAMDIGFLYSYKPNYASKGETDDAYLIDGQQRFTTLFLIWFYLAIKLNKIEDFKTKIRYELKGATIAFDYRVRNITQNFFKDLISKTKSTDDILKLSNKTWFLADYETDVSIKAIANAFKLIHSDCANMSDYEYGYITNQIKFWHFNTNATSQGEELYITMNSRGISISNNESVRAKLFEGIADKKKVLSWGTKWEEWQDLFWKNKGKKNENADIGFDSFLSCIAALENFIRNDKNNFINQGIFNDRGNSARKIYESITLETVNQYYEGFQFLSNTANIKKFTDPYDWSKWLKDCFSEIWSIINSKTNWFADYGHRNRTTEQRRMVFLWSILYYLKQIDADEINTENIYRTLRIYYLRFKNNNRAVAQIIIDIDAIIKQGVWEFNSNVKEENLKHKALRETPIEKIKAIESLIWEIENHKYNLDATDLGAINSSHLINYSEPLEQDNLILIRDKFNNVFDSDNKDLQSLLLLYGQYWHTADPTYYQNYKFDNWKKIIRENIFEQFFGEFLLLNKTIKDLLIEKLHESVVSSDTTNLLDQLLWYLKQLENKIWQQGNNIAISGNNYCALHKIGGNKPDQVFNNTNIIFNTHGSLQGGTPTPLFNMLNLEIQKQFIDNSTESELDI